MKPEWWEGFFTGMALDLWRQAIPEQVTRAEADFIERLLLVAPPAKLLDAPCGEGRLSFELAARGFFLTGVDLSLPFLEAARSKVAQRQLKMSLEHRDMRDLPWQEEFDGAFCFGNSFGYFDDSGNADYLKAVFRVLKPGARFVMDASSCAEIILPKFEERSWAQIGDILFLEENSYDPVWGRYDTAYTFVRDGNVEKKRGSHRIYTYSQHCRLLREAGFAKCEGFGSLQQEPFKLGSERLFLVATKKRE